MEYKVIHDPLHGTIKLEGIFLDLLETPELQRLHHIRQLGLAFLVFPGANHTRFSHSLGTYFVASRIANRLALPAEDQALVNVAALLHDIGHGPFSHTLEFAYYSRFKKSHTDLTSQLISGETVLNGRERTPVSSIAEILETHDVDENKVIELIQGMKTPYGWTLTPWLEGVPAEEPHYLTQLIHGEVDADQLDYLLRDAYYTGVAYGIIDLPYLLNTLVLTNGTLAIDPKGVEAVEGLLVARALMFSSVYYHHAVRISEIMITRAAEETMDHSPHIMCMSDWEFLSHLSRGTGYQRDLINRLQYRQLFKRSYVLYADNNNHTDVLINLTDPENRKEKEQTLCRKAGIPQGYAFIDVPERDILLSEPRISGSGLPVYGGEFRSLAEYTPVATALQKKNIPPWRIMVSAPARYREAVKKVSEKVIFS
jgi:HD superfamily phosphohydrolase